MGYDKAGARKRWCLAGLGSNVERAFDSVCCISREGSEGNDKH